MPSTADIVNLALSRIGYKQRIGSLYDGSDAAKRALDVYAQTRDDLLRARDWPFSQRTAMLTLLKEAPPTGYVPPIVWSTAYPPLPWKYEYAYPTDCLKVRSVKFTQFGETNYDPQPNLFTIVNDPSLAVPAKVIVSNVPGAVCTYSAKVTDPDLWDATFIEAMVAALGRRLATMLGQVDQGQLELIKMESMDEQRSGQVAINTQG